VDNALFEYALHVFAEKAHKCGVAFKVDNKESWWSKWLT